jgi:hypothetical protein
VDGIKEPSPVGCARPGSTSRPRWRWGVCGEIPAFLKLPHAAASAHLARIPGTGDGQSPANPLKRHWEWIRDPRTTHAVPSREPWAYAGPSIQGRCGQLTRPLNRLEPARIDAQQAIVFAVRTRRRASRALAGVARTAERRRDSSVLPGWRSACRPATTRQKLTRRSGQPCTRRASVNSRYVRADGQLRANRQTVREDRTATSPLEAAKIEARKATERSRSARSPSNARGSRYDPRMSDAPPAKIDPDRALNWAP